MANCDLIVINKKASDFIISINQKPKLKNRQEKYYEYG